MEKTIYVLLALLALVTVGVTSTLNSDEKVDTLVAGIDEYQVRVEQSLGLSSSIDVSYLLQTPELEYYNYPFIPSPEIEFLIYLEGNQSLPYDEVFEVYKQVLAEMDDFFLLYGKIDDYWVIPTEEMELAVEDEEIYFEKIVISSLLIDPEGYPLSKEYLQSINDAALKIAEQLELDVRYNESFEETELRSHKLSEFYQEYDQWVTLVLLADDNPFSGREIHDIATGLGLVWGEFDSYHWHNKEKYVGSNYFFSVTNYDGGSFIPEEMAQEDYTTDGILFGFYLPTSGAPEEIFKNMIVAIKYFKSRLGGTIRNLDYEKLDEADLSRMKNVISEITQELTEAGFKPGHDKSLWFFGN